MKCRLACLVLVGSAATLAAQSSADRRRTSLQEEFRFETAVPVSTSPTTTPDEDVTVMEAVTVTESILRRQLVRSVDANSNRIKEQQFSWTQGGLLRSYQKGNRQIDLGIWPKLEHDHYGTELAPILRVKILQIKW